MVYGRTASTAEVAIQVALFAAVHAPSRHGVIATGSTGITLALVVVGHCATLWAFMRILIALFTAPHAPLVGAMHTDVRAINLTLIAPGHLFS